MNVPDHIISGFQDRARAAFYACYKDFQSNCSQMNRDGKELDFKQLQDVYVSRLHGQLRNMARQTLYDNKLQQHDPAGYRLNNIIDEYVHEFVVHTRDL